MLADIGLEIGRVTAALLLRLSDKHHNNVINFLKIKVYNIDTINLNSDNASIRISIEGGVIAYAEKQFT